MPSPFITRVIAKEVAGGQSDINVETLAAGKDLSTTDGVYHKIDPDGDRTIVLPAVKLSFKGQTFVIFNAASTEGELITVNQHADDSDTTRGILDIGTTGTFLHTGSAWAALAEVSNNRTKLIEITGTSTALTAEQSGAVIVSDLTSDVKITLPAAAEGLHFTFVVWKVGSTKDLEITCPSGFFKGGVVFHALGADTMAAVNSDNDSNDFCTLITAEAGTRVEVICDGTNWYIAGYSAGTTTNSFSDTSGL